MADDPDLPGAPAPSPANPAAPQSRAAAAIAELQAVWDKHVPNSPLSRQTGLLNQATELKRGLAALFAHLDDME